MNFLSTFLRLSLRQDPTAKIEILSSQRFPFHKIITEVSDVQACNIYAVLVVGGKGPRPLSLEGLITGISCSSPNWMVVAVLPTWQL